MAVAINTALVNPPQDISSLLSIQCGSGNCTFPELSTVGLCYSCQDVSNQVTIVNRTETEVPGSQPEEVETVILPGSDSDTPELTIVRNTVFNASVTGGDPLSIIQLRTLSKPNDPNAGASAFTCAISTCVKTYNSSVTKLITNESLVSSQPMGVTQLPNQKIGDDIDFNLFSLATSRTLRNGQWEKCETKTNTAPGFLPIAPANIDAAPAAWPNYSQPRETIYYPQDCVWQFGQVARSVITGELMRLLDGQAIQIYPPSTGVGNITAMNIWRNGSIDLMSINGFMQNLTDMMTVPIRQRGIEGPKVWAQGQVIVMSSCVDVRWAWLSYSAALVGLALAFQILLVLQSPEGVLDKAWKSSCLPILFCSLDDSLGQQIRYKKTKNEMEKVAESAWAQLVQTREGVTAFT